MCHSALRIIFSRRQIRKGRHKKNSLLFPYLYENRTQSPLVKVFLPPLTSIKEENNGLIMGNERTLKQSLHKQTLIMSSYLPLVSSYICHWLKPLPYPVTYLQIYCSFVKMPCEPKFQTLLLSYPSLSTPCVCSMHTLIYCLFFLLQRNLQSPNS